MIDTETGAPSAGKYISYRLTEIPSANGRGYIGATQISDDSDETGLIEIDVLPGAVYQFWAGNGAKVVLSVPVDATDESYIAIPPLLSAATP